MSDWQPISTAPKDGQPIRVYDPTRPFTARLSIPAKWNGWAWWRLDRPNGFINMVLHATYWMPLPEPPEVADG